ncbi:MAG: hypothetical protein KatS3mg096_728 [Candidatus Parcubacteria bacterium]|nr:MAG: hypothetical protein KatS3mg096_728 [Candidatus Parcubacteria bacterium]
MMLQKLLADFCRRKYFGGHSSPVQIGVYRPSVLSWSCSRKQWNYYKNFHGKTSDEIPDEVILLLAGGVVFHRLIQNLTSEGRRFWDRVEIECSMEVQLTSGVILIVGHADAIKDGRVYEFKHTRVIPPKPKFEHLLQLNFYLKALKCLEGSLIYSGYTSEGGLGIKEFQTIISNWHVQHLINRAETLHYLLISDTPPRCSCRDHRHEIEVL